MSEDWAATIGARRSVKQAQQAAWLLRAMSCIDLTTLAGDDTPGRVRRLCQKALRPIRRDLLEALGMALSETLTVAHRSEPLADALQRLSGDVALILTGSATSDIDDVAPSAVRQAGGRIDRFGMPVDPGNLLFLGALGARPVIGLPGCARSPALNGADWVLERVVCGVPVTPRDIQGMGVGGLLKDIPERGRQREA